MATDDDSQGVEEPDEGGESSEEATDAAKENTRPEVRRARERLEEGADKAMDEFDQGVVDLLAWLLDTETRARIYVYLRQHPESTSEEVAEGTGLYPSTVREALAELHDEGTVTRQKRESEGAGNNPYEYEAIPPSELVSGVVGQVQNQLNAVFNLDRRLGRGDGEEEGPVKITVSSDEGETTEESEAGEEEGEGAEETEASEGSEAGDETAPDGDAEAADEESKE